MEAAQRLAMRALAVLRGAVAMLVVLFFAYMLGAVLVQVVGRYFAFSIDWAAESATFAQVWMVLLAAGLAMRERLHVRVEALLQQLPTRAVDLLALVTAVACLWFLSLAVRGSLALVQVGVVETSPVLRLPMWLAYLSLPVGLAYFALEFVLALGTEWRERHGEGGSTGT